VLRLLKWFPVLRQLPARFIGLGPRPEHVPQSDHSLKAEFEICSMPRETKTPFPSTNPVVSRTLSAFELMFGAFIVIGHNVFHIVAQ